MTINERTKRRPSLSILAIISFIVSFIVARTFAALNPNTILVGGGYHIHHFWYGIALLALGGWLGISYENERIDRLAAILFGAGGGIMGDEFGLLLTFGDYWTGMTYTIVIVLLTLASAFALINRYSSTIRSEFAGFVRRNASFYFGVFLAAVSLALLALFLDTDGFLIVIISGMLAVVACAIVLAYLIQRIRLGHGRIGRSEVSIARFLLRFSRSEK